MEGEREGRRGKEEDHWMEVENSQQLNSTPHITSESNPGEIRTHTATQNHY